LKKYMDAQGIVLENEDELIQSYKEEIDKEFLEAENHKAYELVDVFQHTYVEIPEELNRQKTEYEQFLNWKEARK